MNTPPRHLPRFLPTLTEVVRPSELSVESKAPKPDAEALTQTLVAQVNVLVQTRVRQELDQLIRAVVAEHAEAAIDRLKVNLHLEIKKMVADAVALQGESNKFNS